MKREMLTTDFLERAVYDYGDVTGVVAHDGTEYTYEEVDDRVNQLAHALEDRGVTQGDRVALLAPNTHYFIETLYATNKLGAVFVPLNYRLEPEEYAYILEDCAAGTVIADYDYADKIEAIREEIPATTFVGYEADQIEGASDGSWEDYEGVLEGKPATEPDRPEVSEDDDASINYTSGTTGDPKGVVRTHRTEHWHALVLNQHMEIRDDDTYLWTLPMFHCNGWGHTYAITGTGASHVCQRTFDAAGVFERVREYDVSFMCGAPTVLNNLIQYAEDRSDLETTGDRDVRIATAGSAPATATIETVEDEFGWRIIHIYGLTETAPIITTSNSPRRLAERGRELKIKQGSQTLCTDVRVVDEDGEDVPRDGETIGEIVVRGNQVMDRYLNKPAITEEAFSERLEGYFHTGDLATMDEDGMVAIQDRKKDIIISGGENISSIELEDILYDHPDVGKAAVVPVPSEQWGETPKAVVVPRSDDPDDADRLEDDLLEFVGERLASYKKPSSVDFVDDLPETATGKVQKYELREEYWDEEETRVGQQ
ncbi:long-chain-fatty-acid--CoA ligase [Natronorubrum daqingense]|uniref:Fatty-acyl-CoA synthase n=1 Tax=Natronorubrum daqingense TaxID=588898 RepID=A0A1N6Z0K2_9EURY|nr:long-chain-fatty-acid--CoA ligase [Natronorubrum daqingense]APX95500.1 long-chain fatty acid--CoA ligase [Natronorubrum daqingense]SIR20364.1 fatty-acyl-CoA synthase [Natronorubrum daqingense]